MSLASLTWLRPWWLLALLPLGLLLWRLWRAPERSAAAWRHLVDAHLLAHLLVLPAPGARRGGLALLAGALLAAVLALAGPAVEQPHAAHQRDVTRLLLLDLSPGMAVSLDQVKLKLLTLLQARFDGQTALLVYGDEPYVVVPPTTDSATIARFVPDLAVDAMPVAGNRPERALRMAAALLARNAARQRELIWITAGSGGAELELAELAGVRLSILQTTPAHDPALAAAAQLSGGVLLRLRADDGDVGLLLSSTEARSGWLAGRANALDGATTDLGYWLLLPLLALAALAFRRGLLALLLGPLLIGALLTPQPAAALELPLAAMWADYQAWRLLQAGQPQAAAERFADPRWRAAALYRAGQFEPAANALASATDADAHYNRGNALAKQGKLVEALAAYDAALALRASDADARYNRDLVQELLKQPPEAPKGGASGKPPPPGAKPPAAGQAPPAPGPAPSQGNTAEREAARVAEQWLRGIPDQPGSLLKRKLLAEQRRRQAAEAPRP